MNKRTIPIIALSSIVLAACGGGDEPSNAVGSDAGENVAIEPTPAPAPAPAPSPGPAPAPEPAPAPVPEPAPAPTPAEPIGARFEVTMTNLTAGQPLSPPALLAHRAGYKLFNLGKPSSTGLEYLAEGAQTQPLIDGAMATGTIAAVATGSAPIGPGGSATIVLEIPASADLSALYLSGASMLVNTNDAITAVRSANLHALAVGDYATQTLISYDTGTEANDEVAAHIPGPAGGGEGFNAARNDISDVVAVHPGVISHDDGLASSALGSIHRWLNPVARIRIKRIE